MADKGERIALNLNALVLLCASGLLAVAAWGGRNALEGVSERQTRDEQRMDREEVLRREADAKLAEQMRLLTEAVHELDTRLVRVETRADVGGGGS